MTGVSNFFPSFYGGTKLSRKIFYVVPNHFTERWWGTKIFSKMGYGIFLNCVKSSSALVSRVKNDCSLNCPQKDPCCLPTIFYNSLGVATSSHNSQKLMALVWCLSMVPFYGAFLWCLFEVPFYGALLCPAGQL